VIKAFNPKEAGEFLLLMDSSSSQETAFWIAAAHIFGGNYRVIQLGPLNTKGYYDWAGWLTDMILTGLI
jgi:hypothetical protein